MSSKPPSTGNAADVSVALWARQWALDVYRYCRRFLRDDAEAEDAMQLVFLQAHQDFATFKETGRPLDWLLSIARHRCLDRLRVRRRLPPTEPMLALANVEQPGRPIDEALAQTEAAKVVLQCLDGLSDDARAAVVLRYHDDLSYEEIEKLTGATAGTLRVRVLRALPLLKQCLEGKGVQW